VASSSGKPSLNPPAGRGRGCLQVFVHALAATSRLSFIAPEIVPTKQSGVWAVGSNVEFFLPPCVVSMGDIDENIQDGANMTLYHPWLVPAIVGRDPSRGPRFGPTLHEFCSASHRRSRAASRRTWHRRAASRPSHGGQSHFHASCFCCMENH
jgi:hypothetical protein